MANYLRPRRGKKATAESQLTASNPLKRGEVFFEVPTGGVGSGAGNIKMGDGTTAYASLPYFINGALIGTTSISSIGNGTITGAISTLNNDLGTLKFRNNSGTAQYTLNGSTWVNFKNPTGTKSITTNGTYDVTDYASASVSVPTGSLSNLTMGATSTIVTTSSSGGGTISCSVGDIFLITCQHSSDKSRSESDYSVSGCTILCQTDVTQTNDGSNRRGSGKSWIVKATSTSISVVGPYVSKACYGKLSI